MVTEYWKKLENNLFNLLKFFHSIVFNPNNQIDKDCPSSLPSDYQKQYPAAPHCCPP